MSEPFVTFVIPTIGRASLARTVQSIVAQTDDAWEALVIGDGVSIPHLEGRLGSLAEHPRVHLLGRPKRLASAGLIRNIGIDSSMGDWTGFVDDDDTIHPCYVEWLREHDAHREFPCVVFRMDDPRLGILPSIEAPRIAWGQVGISFAVRTRLLHEYSLRFIKEQEGVSPPVNEDIELLNAIQKLGLRIFISPHVAYYVRQEPPVTNSIVFDREVPK